MVTVFCWLVAVRARTNPPRVCLMAEFTDSANARWLYVVLSNFFIARLRFAEYFWLSSLSVWILYFLNLRLKNRRIEFVPIKPYASLREARQNFSEKDFPLILESLLKHARTYFTQNPTN